MLLLPSKQQWRNWSFPSKLTAIGAYSGALGVFLTALFFVISYFNPPKTIEKQPDELIAILESRASRVRTELQPYYQYAKVSDFLSQFNELHTKHIAALRAHNLILAHEYLIEIHRLSNDLGNDEFWKRHLIKSPNTGYSWNPRELREGPMICLYVNGSPETAKRCLPKAYSAVGGGSFDDTAKMYNEILNHRESAIDKLRRWWKN